MTLGQLALLSGALVNTFDQEQLDVMHGILLEMLDEFLHICEENDLHYVFIGGSAIGALREQGFIPWDDDMDLAMPRADYDRLYTIIREQYADRFTMLNPKEKENFGRVLPKLRRKNTVYRSPLEGDLRDCGVFIDIYIVENAPSSFLGRLVLGVLCTGAAGLLACKRAHVRRDLYRSFCVGRKREMRIFHLKNLVGMLTPFRLETVARFADRCYRLYRNEQSDYVVIPTDDGGYFHNIMAREGFCTGQKALFEGREVMIPLDYQSYLGKRYGSFMDKPDPRQQKLPLYLEFDPMR